jgi:hypothetical protein
MHNNTTLAQLNNHNNHFVDNDSKYLTTWL